MTLRALVSIMALRAAFIAGDLFEWPWWISWWWRLLKLIAVVVFVAFV